MSPMIALAPCFGCGKPFGFNPDLVPSIVSPTSGSREPICAECVERVNPIREANGLEPIRVLPGAYADTDPEGF